MMSSRPKRNKRCRPVGQHKEFTDAEAVHARVNCLVGSVAESALLWSTKLSANFQFLCMHAKKPTTVPNRDVETERHFQYDEAMLAFSILFNK